MQDRAAKLIAGVDWPRHPLGARDQWPDLLKAVVNTMLGSLESMYLVWGPDRTFLFNDAYIPILGPRLDHAMGARFENLWADAWPAVAENFVLAESGIGSRQVDLPVPMARYGTPEETWWTFSYSPVFDASGKVRGVLCVTNETTSRVKGEQDRARAVAQQDLLNRELSHRVKNTIAMVQALATQSLKAVRQREIVTALEDRLVMLGHAHDILLQNSWQAASINEVMKSVLDIHNVHQQLVFEGPDVRLAASATLSFSLLLHELATNAAKYGALSVDSGRVLVKWDTSGSLPDGRFKLYWRESGGPRVARSPAKGFGSRLIGMGICGTRDADLRYEPGGFEADFSAPLSLLGED